MWAVITCSRTSVWITAQSLILNEIKHTVCMQMTDIWAVMFVQTLLSPSQVQWWNGNRHRLLMYFTHYKSSYIDSYILLFGFDMLCIWVAFKRAKTCQSAGHGWNWFFRAQWSTIWSDLLSYYVHLKCINILTDLRSLLHVCTSNMTFLEAWRLLRFMSLV